MRDRATRWRNCLALGLATFALASACAAEPPATASAPLPACLAGMYNGGQMELAAGLELRADGHFRYGLSYGALDEVAQGSWTSDGQAVFLTSDPVVAPKFVFLGEAPAHPGEFWLDLDLPGSMSRQYFDAVVTMADGSTVRRQLGEDGLRMQLAPGEKPVAVTLLLDVYDLKSQHIALAGSAGSTARFRFEPHDLGKVAFDHTALAIDGDSLTIERYGRLLRFRPQGAGCDQRIKD